MKTKITTDEIGRVTISYDSRSWYSDGERIERTFSCPPDGGYVIEWRNGDWKHVCDRLAGMGSTLSCRSREALPDLIRREYKAMRRDEAREARKNDSWR